MCFVVFHSSLDVGLDSLGGIGSARHAVNAAHSRGLLACVLGQHGRLHLSEDLRRLLVGQRHHLHHLILLDIYTSKGVAPR